MTASADPAAFIKFDISGVFDLKASCDDFWDWEVTEDMFEIAESIDDVRGNDRAFGCMVVLLEFVEVEDKGDRGGEKSTDLP